MTTHYFTPDTIWTGGDYELYVELCDSSSEHFCAVLRALWANPLLEGCYLHKNVEPSEQPRIAPCDHSFESRLYGLARLPNGKRVACDTSVLHYDGEEDCSPLYAISFGITMSALGTAYPVGSYPFSVQDDASSWTQELDEWYAALGAFLYERVPFKFGLIGCEVDVEAHSYQKLQSEGIPEKHADGILWPVGDRLDWYPPAARSK